MCAPGPAASILKMMISKQKIGGGDPLIGVNLSRDLLVYIGLVHLFTLVWTLTGHS